jgi:hypothetical protein
MWKQLNAAKFQPLRNASRDILWILSSVQYLVSLCTAAWLVYGGTSQLSSLSCHSFPTLELPLTLDEEVAEYNYICHVFQVLSLIKLGLISGDTCHDFPHSQNISHYHNHKCCDFKCDVKTWINIVPKCILVKFISQFQSVSVWQT